MSTMELTPTCALASLLEKYSVSSSGNVDIKENTLSMSGKEITLFPWRQERRITELKTLIDNNTVENVSTLRFANFANDDKNLTDLMFKEFDIAEFISSSEIISVYCAITDNKVANIILRLKSGVNASIELSCCLQQGTTPIDRHEIIASRGVASDRVVDTQIPQQSIYLYNDKGEDAFTDTDAELYGLSIDEINIVRDAFAALKNNSTAERNKRKEHIDCVVNAALESAKSGQPVTI